MARHPHRALSPFVRWMPALAVAGAIFALSAQETLPRPPGLSPDAEAIVGHFTVYAMLTTAIWFALPGHAIASRGRLGLALLGALIYGVLDEWHQSFVPGRVPSLSDLLVDAAGILSALALLWAIDRRVQTHRRLAERLDTRDLKDVGDAQRAPSIDVGHPRAAVSPVRGLRAGGDR